MLDCGRLRPMGTLRRISRGGDSLIQGQLAETASIHCVTLKSTWVIAVAASPQGAHCSHLGWALSAQPGHRVASEGK